MHSLPITIQVVCLTLVDGHVHPTQYNDIKFDSEISKQNKDNIIVGGVKPVTGRDIK